MMLPKVPVAGAANNFNSDLQQVIEGTNSLQSGKHSNMRQMKKKFMKFGARHVEKQFHVS